MAQLCIEQGKVHAAARLEQSPLYFVNLYQAVQLNTPATQQFTNALKTYANYTGIPGFDYAQGWLAADLMIKGLEGAGQNPTRQSFITNLSKVTSYNANGLLASPVDYATFDKPPATSCSYSLNWWEPDSSPTAASRSAAS